MKILKEQQDMIKQVESEKMKLFYELEEIKKDYAQKNEALIRKANKASGVIRFDFKEAIQVICYLVSLVEGKEYTYHEQELPIVEYVSGNSEVDFGWAYVDLKFYDHPSFKHKIKLQYICSDEEAAAHEINAVIDEAHVMGVSIYNSKPLPLFYKLLTRPAKNYVQINTNNGHSDFFESMNDCIEFICNDEFGKSLPVTLININSKICDPDFLYIVDFMNYLAVMKLEKEDFTLTLEEMMAYARDFAENVKKQKSGQSNQVLKKVVVEV